MNRWFTSALNLTVASLVGATAFKVCAQPIDNFYKDKQVTIYIGYAAGGGYDLYGRLVARHLGKHIPGAPRLVPQNMPGAGSLKLANYLFNVAPKDGTILGMIAQSTPQEEALGTPGINYRSTEFNWIGRVTSNVELTVVWHTAGVDDILDAKKKEVILAGTGPTTPSEVFPRVLNGVIGTRFKVIGGYGGSSEGVLAMERGETAGALLSWASLKTTKQDWLADNKVRILVQYAAQKHPDLPNIPTMVELGKTEEDRQILALYASGAEIGRSVTAPPGIPEDRVQVLRTAFDSMVKDPKFLAEVEQSNLEFDPLTGLKLQKIIAEAADIPPEVVARAKSVRGTK